MIYDYKDSAMPLFTLGAAYEEGLKLHGEVSRGIKGRVACRRAVCGVIAEIVTNCGGDHTEIGTLFGGTAIIAGRMKKTGKVYIIDPLSGYYGAKVDPISRLKPDRELLEANLKHWNVINKSVIVEAVSNPWPLPEDMCFDTALIDGDHSFGGAMLDWNNLKGWVNRYIMFDNVDTEHPGVVSVFRYACADQNWRPVLVYETCAVLERGA